VGFAIEDFSALRYMPAAAKRPLSFRSCRRTGLLKHQLPLDMIADPDELPPARPFTACIHARDVPDPCRRNSPTTLRHSPGAISFCA
jgi:hypothetical protein